MGFIPERPLMMTTGTDAIKCKYVSMSGASVYGNENDILLILIRIKPLWLFPWTPLCERPGLLLVTWRPELVHVAHPLTRLWVLGGGHHPGPLGLLVLLRT